MVRMYILNFITRWYFDIKFCLKHAAHSPPKEHLFFIKKKKKKTNPKSKKKKKITKKNPKKKKKKKKKKNNADGADAKEQGDLRASWHPESEACQVQA
jgi:hypothetical protein